MNNNQNNVQQPVEQQQPMQPQMQQPIYGGPYNQGPKNSSATAGLVLGIVSLCSMFIGWFIAGIFMGIIGLATGITGIVLSANARKNPAGAGNATAGLVLSIIGTALAALEFTCAMCVVCAAAAVLY